MSFVSLNINANKAYCSSLGIFSRSFTEIDLLSTITILRSAKLFSALLMVRSID